VFSAGKKIDYSKSDYKLYSETNSATEGAAAAGGLEPKQKDEIYSKKITPLK
jgi:hypothetical protein